MGYLNYILIFEILIHILIPNPYSSDLYLISIFLIQKSPKFLSFLEI